LCLYFIVCPYFLEGDPNNYLTYFKRGTVYLALGKSKFALMDLDKVLQLKPDFTSVSILKNRKPDKEMKVHTFSFYVCVMNEFVIMQSAFRYPVCNCGEGHYGKYENSRENVVSLSCIFDSTFIQIISFIITLSPAAVSHRKPASPGTSCDGCGAWYSGKRNAVY